MLKRKYSPNKLELSVILPVLVENPNEVKVAKERILAYQTLAHFYKGAEIIVVDDGSCDEMLDWYANHKQPLLKVLTLPKAGDWTQARAKNLGIQLAVGKKLFITDLAYLPRPLTFAFMLKAQLENNEAALFKYKSVTTGQEINGGSNVFLINRIMGRFFHEQFCGTWGSETSHFFDYHKVKWTQTGMEIMVNEKWNTHALLKDPEEATEVRIQLMKSNEPPEVTDYEDVFTESNTICLP